MLGRVSHTGPLRVQRAFYPEPGQTLPHVYVLHPPGGVVGGDELSIDIEVAPRAAALVTTPAAGKLYRHPERWSRQTVSCRVAAGATLEWLPQELIAFSGCHGRSSLAVELERGAGFLGWEVLQLGRAACAEVFAAGELDQRLHLARAGRARLCERARIGGSSGAAILDAPWGLRGQPVHGTLIAAAPAPELPLAVDELSELAAELGCGGAAAVSRLEDDLLAARYLGPSAAAARAFFERLRAAIRPAWLGRPAVAPRIWDT